MRVLRREGLELGQLGGGGNDLVLQFGHLLQLHGGLALGVDHALGVAVAGQGQGGGFGLGLGLGHFSRCKADQVLAAALVQAVDQRFAEFEQLGVDGLGVLRGVGVHAQGGDGRGAVVLQLNLLLVVAVQGFKAGVKADGQVQPAKAAEDVHAAGAVGFAHIEGGVDFLEGVARQRVVVHGVAVVLRARKTSTFENGAQG